MSVIGDIAILDIKRLLVHPRSPVMMKRNRPRLQKKEVDRKHRGNINIVLKIKPHRSASIYRKIYAQTQIPQIDPTAIRVPTLMVVQGVDIPETIVTTTPSENEEEPPKCPATLLYQWTPQVSSQHNSCKGFQAGVIPKLDGQFDPIYT